MVDTLVRRDFVATEQVPCESLQKLTSVTSPSKCLELMDAQFTIQSLCSVERNVHIHIRVDSFTAVAYINDMRGKRSQCIHVAICL